MNNLTTRKIVLGLLMALVLVFSVQGIADALTLTRRTSDDLKTVRRGDQFTINFNVSDLTAATSAVDEMLTIPVPVNTDLTLKRIGSYTIPSAAANAPVTLYEAFDSTEHKSYQRLRNGNSSVTYQVDDNATYGSIDLSIGSLSFTVYVVPRDNEVGTAEVTITLTGQDGPGFDARSGADPINVTIGTANLPVTYRIIEGSGNIYVRDTADSTRATPSRSRGQDLLTSSAAADSVYLDMRGSSNKVTVTVGDQYRYAKTFTFVYGRPKLTKTLSGDGQEGVFGGQLAEALEVKLTDEKNKAISGVPVRFAPTGSSIIIAFPGTTVYVGSNGALDADTIGSLDDTTIATSNRPDPGNAGEGASVRTDSGGVAKIYLQLLARPGTETTDEETVTVSFPNAFEETFSVTAIHEITATTLETLPIEKVDDLNYDLTVRVRRGGHNVPSQNVTFTTGKGSFTRNNSEPLGARTQQSIVPTQPDGTASVRYYIGEDTGSRTVFARTTDAEFTRILEESFTINPGGGGGGGGSDDTTPVNRLAITPTSISGAPDATRAITVTALNTSNVSVSNVSVTLGGLTSFLADGGTLSSTAGVTPFTSTFTLPDTAATHLITAFATGYTSVSTLVTVTAVAAPGTLSITTVGAAVNGQQTIEVTARNSAGTAPSGAVPVTLTGPGISRTVDTLGGTGRAIITLPTATVSYVLTVSATGYTSGSVTLTPSGQTTTTTTTTTREVAGEADSVEIDGQRQLSGTVNQAMRLRVRVLDANDDGVSDVTVTFRVLAPGRGTFSGGRGNRRGVTDATDRNGYASANFTPSDDGDIIVRATAAGVRDPVTFIIDVGEAPDDTETPTPSEDAAPSREINPVVHVGAASRPPMLWVDGGAIYALVGASEQRFAPSVDNALNITVAGGKVYWTEKTGESGGTINSANLNGSDVTELTSIRAVPMGIAVDTAGSKLYWTNSRGRIQSADLDGSGITNELQDLPSPMDIALGRGIVYWTQGNGSVRLVNLTGQKIVRDISTGSDTPGSLVIGNGKVYWTEMTGDSSGTINSANLNGTDVKELTSIRAVPMGIAVDGARSKLYWTNSRGRVQSADLDGSGITNVVSGLGSPGDMVLSNSIAAPAATPTTPTTPTASRSKYDLNGDGAVDNTDAGLVADAMGTSNARYDVNGDGTVNFLDLLLVFDNRDAGAAGAPTIVGMKLSAAQIDIIEEQIDLLIATNDRSPAAMRVLIYLQQLLVTARPEKTQLLANYPNPFNPETWIPYELATDTNVKVTIYNTQGVVIRTLAFGHQSAGYYTGRDRAAYWDGRNALGEQVASGLYFYQLETDEMSSMRKMVILK